nr:M48 family metallopeptidase [uncultured Actinoplanes sp.]
MVTLAAAGLLLLGVLAIAGTGVWLVVSDWFSLRTVVGVALLGLAFALRPRLNRMKNLLEYHRQIEPATAPSLFALIDRVAAAVGAPAPRIVLFSEDYNAFTATVGLRGRRVLGLGAPLWATLDEGERVALLGHEMGHFVNGDVRRGPLVRVAETTLARLADLVGPDHLADGPLEMVGMLIARFFQRLVLAVHVVLLAFERRDSQRAEYLADDLAARAAGTRAAIRLTDRLLIMEAVDTVVRREARAGQGAAAWRAAGDTARANLAPELGLLRQLSMRNDVSLWDTHPPAGLRGRMLERRSDHAPAVQLTETESARIDEELAAHYEWARRELRA